MKTVRESIEDSIAKRKIKMPFTWKKIIELGVIKAEELTKWEKTKKSV